MKILFILYNFSPKGTASSIQNKRFIEEINSRNDIDYRVITKESSYKEFASKSIEINSSWFDFILKIFGKIFPDFSNIPDTQVFWSKKVVKYILKNLNWDFDVIYTISSPFSAHIIGNVIKKEKKCIWVAHYFDPWNENSFRKYNFNFFRKFDFNNESNCILNADLVIHTNEYLVNKWKERFHESFLNRVKVHPLFTDPDIVYNKSIDFKAKTSPYYFLHSGGVYGNRSFRVLLESFTLLSREMDLADKIKIIQVGYVSPENEKLVKNSSFYSLFTFISRSRYDFVVQKSLEADFLLLIDNPEIDNFFFPSKICEYFSFNKPIIGLVSNNSISKRYLIESGHLNIDFNDPVSLKSSILFLLNGNKVSFDDQFYKKFLPKSIVNNILTDLKEYVQK